MNKNKRSIRRQSGFTLIELLVVIAIIGILATVVLSSLGSARNKGKDSAVKTQISNMRAQAELYYSKNETYQDICTNSLSSDGFGGAGGPGLLYSIMDSIGITSSFNLDISIAGDWNKVTCHVASDGESWAVEAPMVDSVSTSRVMFCADNTGASKTTKGSSQAQANLAANSAVCN